MGLPSEMDNGASTRFCTLCAVALLIVVAIATAASWSLYPLFVDTYYHMGVIEGFSQAGGITTRAFWEMAPGGRVHIYPPSLHVIGYFLDLVGVSPRVYVTLVSATFYALCLLTTWIWLRRIIGARSALFAMVLLCGPYAFFWTQATFNAVAGVMILAPLAFLALETERFLACGVLSFVAITMHPMGLFLPPALAINTLLRRKKIVAGLLAASVPVVLYAPWLAHIWANRAFLPDNRTGGEITLGGVGGGANLGLLLVPLAALSVPWLIVRRGPALGLIGGLLGFAVVLPMGFGSRLLAFNIHWPLACLGGYGLGELVRWLEQRASLRAGAYVFSVVVAGTALVAYPALNVPLGGRMGGRPPGGPPVNERMREETRSMFSNWRFTVQAGALPKLFETYSGQGAGGGMGPMGPGPMGPGPMGPGPMGPGPMGGGPMGGGPAAGPGGFPGGGPGMGPGGFPGGFLGRGPGMDSPARPGAARGTEGRRPGLEPQTGGRQQVGRGRGGGGGMPGMDLLGRPGAEDFFEAVKAHVNPGDVIHIEDGPAASLLAGVTGRWTSSGILRDVRSDNGRVRPEECDFAAVLSGGMGMPGPGGPMASQDSLSKFEKVFENEYGSLYRNTATVEHAREPLKPAVSLPLLSAIAIVGFLLVLIDLLPARRAYARPMAAVVGTVVVALCFLPLTSIAIDELRNPPSAPPRGPDGGPGFGPPGFGPPGFGGPGFGPGPVLAEGFLREADSDRSGAMSLEEFRALAGRWSEQWDADRNGSLQLEEVAQHLQSLLGPPPGMDGPMPPPDGPPGFGPGAFLGQGIFAACDSDRDGKLTRDELVGAFERWFRQWDEGSKGSLDAAALGRGLDRILGPPPMPGFPE